MPRFSRISWKSLEEAEPPTIASINEAAKRRSSRREMPGALRQTWYCSVSLRWKRTPGAPVTSRPPLGQARTVGRALASRAKQRHELGVADVPGRCEHDAIRPIGTAVVRGEPAARDARDHGRAPDHRAPERMAPEDRLGGDVVDEVVGRVLNHRDLLEHDFALGVDVHEGRPEDHVRHYVERALESHVRDARVDDRRLARGGGVQLAAELVEDLGDLLRRVAGRALEEHVLDEVRDARARIRLVTRARTDPEAERDRADPREPAPR